MVVASLIDSLSKVGAITGIVSFVGVGLLILLVAAQSRQIRAMREWIDAEPERQAETAQRVIAEVQRRIAAARERRAAATTGPSVAPPVPGAPRQVPPAPGTLGATPEARAVAAAKAGDSTSAPADPAAGSVPPPTGDAPAEGAADAPKFAPLTPAADAEASAEVPAEAAPAVDDLLVDPVVPAEPGQETQPADALPPEYDPLGAATPAAQSVDAPYAEEHFAFDQDYHEEDEHPRGNRLLFGIGAAALVAGIVLAGILLFGGGSDTPSSSAGGGADSTQSDGSGDSGSSDGGGNTATTPAAVNPADVRVTVLNGTQVTGLAQKITDRLSGKGYGTGQPNTFSSDQTLTSTTVQYRPGHAPDARQVAKDLGLATSAAQPINADVGAAAPETADVVVVTGQDLAASADSGTTTG